MLTRKCCNHYIIIGRCQRRRPAKKGRRKKKSEDTKIDNESQWNQFIGFCSSEKNKLTHKAIIPENAVNIEVEELLAI